jgi:hypothetical protein
MQAQGIVASLDLCLARRLWQEVLQFRPVTPLYLFDGGSRCIMIRIGPVG